MKIPDSMTVNTGEQEKAHRTIDQFFLNVKSGIENEASQEKRPSEFSIEVRNLCALTPMDPQPTDNFAHLLFYQEKVVAVVTETRTPNNYIHFDYFLKEDYRVN